MSIPTCTVSFDLGAEKAGALVVAVLGTAREVSATEMLVEHKTVAQADANGVGSLVLWSNAALNNGSKYRAYIAHSSGDQLLTGGIVPNAPSASFDSVFNTTPSTALLIDGFPLLIDGAPIVF